MPQPAQPSQPHGRPPRLTCRNERPQTRHPRPVPEPAVLDCRDPVADHRHRREHGHLHADRSDPAAQAAGEEPRRSGDAVPAGPALRQQHRVAGALLPHLPGVPEARGAAGRGAGPSAGGGVGQHRQPDRARRGGDGVGQLLLDARRGTGGGPLVQLAGRRPGLLRPPGRCAQLRLLEHALLARPGRRGQEDPRQQLPDDHRRRVGRGLRGHRPGAVAADSRAAAHEAGDRPRMAMGPHERRAHAVGAGVRAAQAGLHRGERAGAAAGSVHADSPARDDAARRQGLVALPA